MMTFDSAQIYTH